MDKAMFLSLRTSEALFSSAIRKCGIYKQGPEREICISKIKLNSLTKQLSIYRRLFAGCGKQKNPENCRNKITGKLEKLNREIEIQKNNLIAYTREIETQKRDQEFKEEEKRSKKI
jgi:hypothetical protein